MKKVKFSQILDFQKKSHIKAGDGLKNGSFPFFTSSPVLSKYVDSFQFCSPSLIFGTGGSASVHICENSFSVSTDCLVAQLKPEADKRFDIKFIYYYLFGNIEILENGFKGAGLKHISKGYINNIDIPELSFEDQKRIVKMIDKADVLRQKRKESIKSLDDYLKSVFLEMFGDPVKNTKKWGVKELKELTSKIGSGATPRGGKTAYLKEGISLIRSLNIHDNKFLYKDLAFLDDKQAKALLNVTVEKKDILLNITGASVCRCAIVPDDVLPARVNQHVSIIRTKEINELFLLHLIISKSYKRKLLKDASSGGATREALTKQQLEKMIIINPPLELQNKFSEIVQKTESIKQKMFIQSTELEAQFQSLIQKAFKGEL